MRRAERIRKRGMKETLMAPFFSMFRPSPTGALAIVDVKELSADEFCQQLVN
ncbi:hypothetical protein D3C87_1151510 [compost metagenome]